jgi:hypothetical protein
LGQKVTKFFFVACASDSRRISLLKNYVYNFTKLNYANLLLETVSITIYTFQLPKILVSQDSETHYFHLFLGNPDPQIGFQLAQNVVTEE